MPWFRLEESFHSNPKVLAAGNGPVGLWVRCATWSAEHLTDGVIPMHVARQIGTKREMDALTACRLWVPIDDGLVLPDWSQYQPSSLEVKRRRQRDAERKRAERATGAGAVIHDPLTGQFMRRPDERPFR